MKQPFQVGDKVRFKTVMERGMTGTVIEVRRKMVVVQTDQMAYGRNFFTVRAKKLEKIGD